jgi:hypothetical protein
MYSETVVENSKWDKVNTFTKLGSIRDERKASLSSKHILTALSKNLCGKGLTGMK